MAKKKKSKVSIVESRPQLHALLDLLLNRASETGKAYHGKFKLPLTTIIIGGHEGSVSFDVQIKVKCNGRFIDETSSIEVNSDKRSH